MFAVWSLRYAIFLHQSSLEVYYKVKLWLVPPQIGDKVCKSQGVMVVDGSLGGSQGRQRKGLQAPRGFGRGIFMGAPLATVHSIVLQLMCVEHSGTAHVCAVQWYSTWLCSTVL